MEIFQKLITTKKIKNFVHSVHQMLFQYPINVNTCKRGYENVEHNVVNP